MPSAGICARRFFQKMLVQFSVVSHVAQQAGNRNRRSATVESLFIV